jgi:hypothetical protein
VLINAQIAARLSFLDAVMGPCTERAVQVAVPR